MTTKLPLRQPAWVQEFIGFIAKGNVVDLAVGIIIGAAFTTVVGSLVKDLFNPLVGLLVGGIDFSNIFVTLKGPSQPTLEAAKAAGAVTLNLGVFLNAIIQFLIVGFAVFWLVKVLSRLQLAGQAAGPSRTEALLTEIRDILRERPPAQP
jgi:large conductance mechanosensitive channel